jgi:hypothetical protein
MGFFDFLPDDDTPVPILDRGTTIQSVSASVATADNGNATVITTMLLQTASGQEVWQYYSYAKTWYRLI